MKKNLLKEDKNQPGESESEIQAQSFAAELDEEIWSVQPFEPKIAEDDSLRSDQPKAKNETIFQSDFHPESPAETVRKSGLAYAAGITLVGAIVVMLFIGWGVDSFLGSSPWGIVSGIILGSVIGFYQFFRLTSQILKNKD
jgi:ATP synthase protein I